MKKSFILYTEVWPVVQKLDMEQRGRLFTAIMQHAMEEEPEKLDILTDVVFSFIASQMDRDNQKYQEICERRAEYGRRGGLASAQAKATKSKQTKQKQANQADNDNDNENDNDNDNDNENENENEAPVALPDLSLRDEESLRSVAGDRADGLIEDVRAYYTSHPEKAFPGWPIALAQFDRNQRRWNKGSPKRQKTTEELAAEIFAEMEEET